TRDHDADWIGAVGRTDGPHRCRCADGCSKVAIGDGVTARYAAQCAPHALLERGATGVHRDRIERVERTREVRRQPARDARRLVDRRELDGAEPALEPPRAPGPAVVEGERAHAVLAYRHADETERRNELGDREPHRPAVQRYMVA